MIITKKITFIKDSHGWYADIKGHTRGENSMVMGADKLCESISKGNNKIDVELIHTDKVVKGECPTKDECILHLRRIEHDPFGATYWVSGKYAKLLKVKVAWICNVTHDALGCDHPKHIYITNISYDTIKLPAEPIVNSAINDYLNHSRKTRRKVCTL